LDTNAVVNRARTWFFENFQLQRRIAAFEQALQFKHALARHDDLARTSPSAIPAASSHSASRWPSVATQRKPLLAQVDQQAVEVIAHVLLGHREGAAFDQLLELPSVDLDAFLDQSPASVGKLARRQVARV
jgi:hypothetical protein